MPNPKPVDGYVEVPARVCSTALVHLQRNRYSVPSEHAHQVVSLRLYPDRLEVVAHAMNRCGCPVRSASPGTDIGVTLLERTLRKPIPEGAASGDLSPDGQGSPQC